MAIDATIPLRALGAQEQQGSNDPFSTIKSMQEIRSNENKNRLFQNEFASRKALGPIFANNIDPKTGDWDIAGVQRDLSNSPEAAWKAPEIMAQLAQKRQTQLANAKTELEMADKYLGMLDTTFSGLLEKGKNINRADVVKQLTQLSTKLRVGGMTHGLADPDHMAQILMMVPDSPDGIEEMVRQATIRNMDAKDRVGTLYGKITQADTGNAITSLQEIPFTGQVKQLQTLPKSLTPGEANEIVTLEDENGVKSQYLKKDLVGGRPKPGAKKVNEGGGGLPIADEGGGADEEPNGRVIPGGQEINGQPVLEGWDETRGPNEQQRNGQIKPDGQMIDGLPVVEGVDVSRPQPEPNGRINPNGQTINGLPVIEGWQEGGGGAGETGDVGSGGGGGVQIAQTPTLGDRAAGATPLRGGSGLPVAGAPDKALARTSPTALLEYQKDAGKNIAKYEEGLNEFVNGSQGLLKRLEEQRDLLRDIRAGGGSKLRASAAEIGQAVGMPQRWVDEIANGNLGAAQEFNKNSVIGAMETLRQTMPAGSRINMLEYSNFDKNNPNLDTDPRAIEKIFNFASRMYKLNKAEQDALNVARREKGFDPLEWPNRWMTMAEKRGLVTAKEVTGLNRDTALPVGKANRRSPDEIMNEVLGR